MKLLFSQYVHALSDAVIASNEECVNELTDVPRQPISDWWPMFFSATPLNAAAFKESCKSSCLSTHEGQYNVGRAARANKRSPKKTINAPYNRAAVENLTEPDPEFTRALAALEKIVGRAKASVSMTQTVLAKVLDADRVAI